jgi:hypothetical protein
MVVLPILRYASIEGGIISKWLLFLPLSPPVLLFMAYLVSELANLASKIVTMWRVMLALRLSEVTSPKEGASVNVSV